MIENKKTKRRFTLIELLVVIAIISILAAMLLPALRGAKEMAIKSTCQSTQKSIGYAHAMYISDYDEYMADFSPDIYNNSYTGQPWITKIAPYVNVDVSLVQNGTYGSLKPCDNPQTRNVLCCPKRPWGVFGSGPGTPGNFSSYHLSLYLNNSNNVRPSKISIVSRPSCKVYLGDAADSHSGYVPNTFSPNLNIGKTPILGGNIEILHNLTSNFLFLDGHVTSYGRKTLPLSNPAWNDGRKWIDVTYDPVPDNL
ncbi:MAG: prepilin-type N-terminal cleavage/methylation domain-containing protein [Victivallales bacterium]|nr:prepilin-type N-terminal cleavage/methylation domain-containing protein [Victivallales bacterium]